MTIQTQTRTQYEKSPTGTVVAKLSFKVGVDKSYKVSATIINLPYLPNTIAVRGEYWPMQPIGFLTEGAEHQYSPRWS